MRRLLTAVLSLGVVFAGVTVQAQNLLTNGNFEAGAGPPIIPSWTTIEENVDNPSVAVNSIGHESFADRLAPPELATAKGLWLAPWSGTTCCGVDPNPPWETNYAVNGYITQTVPGVAGDTYTLLGSSRFEQNYSGGVDELDILSPFRGGQPSPTETFMKIEFLNASNSVIGSSTFDVKADREVQVGGPFANNNAWYAHSLSGVVAPANTTNVRVIAGMTNGVFNADPSQSAFMDDFSLMRSGAPATELLTNGNLNTSPPPPPELPGFTLVEVGTGANQDTAAKGGNFADNPNTPGDFGYWVKAFVPGSATLTQRVEGVENGDYTFSLANAFGQNYSGGTGPSKPTTLTIMELAFLNASEVQIGAPVQLDLWDAGQRNAPGPIAANPQAWDEFSIDGTSPLGTAFVEVRIKTTGTFATTNPDQGAFFDDLSLTLASAVLAGDHNGDGIVDAADYVAWRKNPTAFGGDAGYDDWVANFGEPGPGGGNGGSAVPEPAAGLLALVAVACCATIRRQKTFVSN